MNLLTNPIEEKNFEEAVQKAESKFIKWRNLTDSFEMVEAWIVKRFPKLNSARVAHEGWIQYQS